MLMNEHKLDRKNTFISVSIVTGYCIVNRHPVRLHLAVNEFIIFHIVIVEL